MAKTSTLVKVSAAGKWDSGVKTDISIRNFSVFSMDEPPTLGGGDAGAMPLEYVLAALNGCKGVMIPLVAQELDFVFSGIDFESTGIVDTKGLMGEEGVSTYFQKIRFTANIHTEESEERIEQLKYEVERRCPVLNLFIAAGIKLDIQWKKI